MEVVLHSPDQTVVVLWCGRLSTGLGQDLPPNLFLPLGRCRHGAVRRPPGAGIEPVASPERGRGKRGRGQWAVLLEIHLLPQGIGFFSGCGQGQSDFLQLVLVSSGQVFENSELKDIMAILNCKYFMLTF